ncbi:MAG: hypothetical protein V2A61_07815, partial [Calditrichota bacterium]
CQLLSSTLSLIGSNCPGWNKAWIQDELIGWYGTTATTIPLRLLTVLFRSKPGAESVRQYVNSIFNIDGDDPEDPSNVLLQHLSGFALEPFSRDNQILLRFLQRLNLDQREQPVIEKWRWSNSGGTALFSDGGSVRITLDTAWAWALESTVTQNCWEYSSLIEFLHYIIPGEFECSLPPSPRSEPVNNLIDQLIGFGLLDDFSDLLRWRIPPGSFPQMWAALNPQR